MALNEKLITISDVRVYRDLSANFSQARFDAILLEIENIQLRQMLGDELWYDFFINISETKYATLKNGESYVIDGETIYYPGLKPYLIWSLLAVVALEANVFFADYGNVSLVDPAAKPAKWELSQVIEGFKQNANDQRNQIIKYLNQKYATYTKWDYKNEQNFTNSTFDII